MYFTVYQLIAAVTRHVVQLSPDNYRILGGKFWTGKFFGYKYAFMDNILYNCKFLISQSKINEVN